MTRFLTTAVFTGGLLTASCGAASAAMPAAQETALVEKYCGVCHSDAHMNGGFSLDRFDAAHADPGLAAMLLSKLTSGVSLEKVRAAQTDPGAAAIVVAKMKTGAMGAAGIPVPDRSTQDALVAALAVQADGAGAWVVNRMPVNGTTASIVREAPSALNPGEANLYRLTLTCRPDTHEGEMLLAWAPGAVKKGQTLSATVDGKTPVTYKTESEEKVFTGATGTSGIGAALLHATRLPEQTLTIADLFPNETVVFPFDALTQAARKTLSACFTGQ